MEYLSVVSAKNSCEAVKLGLWYGNSCSVGTADRDLSGPIDYFSVQLHIHLFFNFIVPIFMLTKKYRKKQTKSLL